MLAAVNAASIASLASSLAKTLLRTNVLDCPRNIDSEKQLAAVIFAQFHSGISAA
jgi:hypothetical protein